MTKEPSGYVILTREVFEKLLDVENRPWLRIEWCEPYTDSVFLENIYSPTTYLVNEWTGEDETKLTDYNPYG